MTLVEKASRYANGVRILSDWLGSGAQVVDKETAQKRANVCIKCPMNQNGNMVTKAIAWAIKEQTDLKSELELRVDGEKSLHSCAVCSCWLKLKIWIPMNQLRSEETPEDKAKWPAWCWMKTET